MEEIVAAAPMLGSDVEQHVSMLAERLADLEAQRGRLIDMAQRGITSMSEVEPRMARIDKDVAAIRLELSELGGMQVETIEDRRARLREFMLSADDIFERLPVVEANTILRRTLRMYIADGSVDRIETI